MLRTVEYVLLGIGKDDVCSARVNALMPALMLALGISIESVPYHSSNYEMNRKYMQLT